MRRIPSARGRGRLGLLAALLLLALVSPAQGAVAPLTTAAAPAASEDGWIRKAPPISTPWTEQVGPDNALPEYPRPQMTRERWQNLNGVWQFAAAGPADAAPFGKALAERVLVPYPIESALSGIMRHEDRMWYRRTFTVPADWRAGGERLQLHFGAVDYAAAVWVNGTRVATHVGGYDPWSVDITDQLKPSGEQELIVGVADSTDAPSPNQALHVGTHHGDGMGAITELASTRWNVVGKQRFRRGSIWYTAASGIWQTVWLEPTPAGHIERLDMAPDLANETLDLTVQTAGDVKGQVVEAVVSDGDRIVSRVHGPAQKPLELPVPDPRLWSPDDPHLYDLRVTLRDGASTDQVGSYFGMRSIALGKDDKGVTRMLLNGKPLTQIGPLDQGYWPDGIYTAPTDEALRYDLEQTKRLGFNMTRKHIKVEPDRWYYWADRLGLLVWQDMPSMQALYADTNYPPVTAQREFVRQLERMVTTHKSWTSIVVWVPFNEGWGEWDKTATGEIADQVKAWDPSRLVNANSGVTCCWANNKNAPSRLPGTYGDSMKGDIWDDHTYTGPGEPMMFPDRASAAGEYGGYGLAAPGHQWSNATYAYSMTSDSDALTGCIVATQRRFGRFVPRGYSAGIYTQMTDVEDEVNGFLTYDRQVMKVDVDRIRAIHEAIISGANLDTAGGTGGAGQSGTAGAIGLWNFDEGSGTTAGDSSGQGNAGTLKGGAAWVPGYKGSGIGLNGNTSFVDMGRTVVDTSKDFTVSAWVKLNNPGPKWETFVSEDGDTASAFFLQFSQANQRLAFSTTAGRALSQEAPQANRWYHVVGVRSADSMKLFVDGALAGQLDTCIPSRATGPLVVGRGKSGGGNVDFVNGIVDGVRVYDRALADADVAALYNEEK